MDRGIPTSSKLISNRIHNKNRQLHLSKLNSVKSMINCETPKAYSHLKVNKKKTQLEEQRLIEIDRENKILLDKMTHIMKAGCTSPQSALERGNKGSLNRNVRKKELVKITIENQNIIQRLGDQRSAYDVNTWDKDARQHELYVKNISEYPWMLTDAKMRYPESPHKTFYGRKKHLSEFSKSRSESLSSTVKQSSSPLNFHSPRKFRTEKLAPLGKQEQRKILYQCKRKIGFSIYQIYVYYNHNIFNIMASNNDRADVKVFTASKHQGEYIISQFGGNFEELVDCLQFRGSQIILGSESVEPSQRNPTDYKSDDGIAEAHDENDVHEDSQSQINQDPQETVVQKANVQLEENQEPEDHPVIAPKISNQSPSEEIQTKVSDGVQQSQRTNGEQVIDQPSDVVDSPKPEEVREEEQILVLPSEEQNIEDVRDNEDDKDNENHKNEEIGTQNEKNEEDDKHDSEKEAILEDVAQQDSEKREQEHTNRQEENTEKIEEEQRENSESEKANREQEAI